MNFNDAGLIKNGNVDLEYADKWLHSLKDLYDISDVKKDRVDILLILKVYDCNGFLMFKKFQELHSKYSIYVNMINVAMNWVSYNNSNFNLKEQLMMFYDYLPVLWLMKTGITKVFDKMIEKRLLACAI